MISLLFLVLMTSTKILNIIRLCWRVSLPPHIYTTQGQRKLLQSKGTTLLNEVIFYCKNYVYIYTLILMEVLYLRKALVPGPSYFCHLKFRNIISLWCEIDSCMWLLSFHASISICTATVSNLCLSLPFFSPPYTDWLIIHLSSSARTAVILPHSPIT